MNENYAKKGLPFPDSDGVQQAAETVTGQSFAEFFHDYVAGVLELPYNEYFQFVGLQVAETTVRTSTPGFTTSANLGGQPEVASVDANSDAHRAGVAIGDRIVEVDGKPATASIDDQLARMRAGTTVKISLANRRGTANRQAQTRLARGAGLHPPGCSLRHPRTTRTPRGLDPWR